MLTEKIEHFWNPVLLWMLASTVVKTDPAGNIKPDKEKSVQKIDGIVAGIMALAQKKQNAHRSERCVTW